MRKKLPSNEMPDLLSCEMMWGINGCIEPLYELEESETEIIIRIDMPNVQKKEDITIQLTEDTITIEAKMYKVFQYEHWGTFQRHTRFSSYSKSFKLPATIDPEKSKARFIKNILELRMPKRQAQHRIKIQ